MRTAAADKFAAARVHHRFRYIKRQRQKADRTFTKMAAIWLLEQLSSRISAALFLDAFSYHRCMLILLLDYVCSERSW